MAERVALITGGATRQKGNHRRQSLVDLRTMAFQVHRWTDWETHPTT